MESLGVRTCPPSGSSESESELDELSDEPDSEEVGGSMSIWDSEMMEAR